MTVSGGLGYIWCAKVAFKFELTGRWSTPIIVRIATDENERSDSGVSVVQTMMLAEREAVGHPSEVVGRNPRGRGFVRAGSELSPFPRQALRLGEVEREQVVDHPVRL